MPFIKKEIVEKVLETSDLIEVIKDYVDLKKSGANLKGISPFVKEKTPSFSVSPSKSIWKDFSSGKGGNSAAQFLMEKEKISFPEAIEILAKKYVIDIEYDESGNTKDFHVNEERRQKLRNVLESAIRKYEEEFNNLSENHPAKTEIYKKREYNDKIIDSYRIGYAPGGSLIYNLCLKNNCLPEAIELGLINETHLKDKWNNRIIYPLIDRKGNDNIPIGLAGRSLSDSNKYPKWMNSTDSEIYKKEKFWYGLDKARKEISSRGEAWIVEGYNDVISFQENGIPNTIAPCGTAISESQIRIIKKLCDKVIFCFDSDPAGKKAMLKYIPELIRQGFRVQTATLDNNLDPDDFVRFHKKSDGKDTISDFGTDADRRKDGFSFLMEETFSGKDEIDIAKEARNLVVLISDMSDEAMKSIYLDWLAKQSKIKKALVNSWMKEQNKKITPEIETDDFYILPKEVLEPIKDLRSTIEKYQLFMANNQIWIQVQTGPPYSFRSVSNFIIKILTHMQDEKLPTKLVRIKNVHGLERIFDIPSSDINNNKSFENAVTAHGNFRWKGGIREHELLKTYLFDTMGTGRKIDVLGWQPGEKFWAWNNKITVPGGTDIEVDSNGVFEKDDISYYIPSANNIYRTNFYKYEAQKKVISISASVNFQNFCSQVVKVHREHGIMGILFSVASMFQDIVEAELSSFPMLFLIGPPSSGKDQLADLCQSFFGLPQTAINLEGGVSTIKAQVREFAQFSNTISHLSEYKTGDPKLDGVLKGLWDRRGYKRGNIDSHVGTESIPILSSVLMTGNYPPDQEALITRLIWEFMDKTEFNDVENKEYEKLSDMTQNGISSFTEDFLQYRSHIQKNFKGKFREFKSTLGQRNPEANSRIIQNLAVLGTFYQIFNDIITFTFTHEDMMSHFEDTIDKQMRKMNSASVINRWWDCFLASMRGTYADQIRIGRDFKIVGEELYFNFTNCYNRVSRQWFTQYRDSAPAKTVMMESLKKDTSWINDTKGTRMDKGKNSKSTSAYIVNITEIPIKDEIKYAIQFQINETDSRQYNQNDLEEESNKNNDPQSDLPF